MKRYLCLLLVLSGCQQHNLQVQQAQKLLEPEVLGYAQPCAGYEGGTYREREIDRVRFPGAMTPAVPDPDKECIPAIHD